ncbi:MAG: hypothetical protein ICV59_09355 [Thermoleophilia bacterium]|nr:hypothetical protein [Thermoleophilia bacterium]
MKKLSKKTVALMATVGALFALATAAFALVTFDPATGTGFVGKGDVQTAFGWNNAQMQARHTVISFEYRVQESLEQDCSENLGRGVFAVRGERTKTDSVISQLAYDNRQKKQYVGWNLTDFGTTTSENTGWVGPNGETTGNACPDGSTPHGAVRVLSSVEGLYAVYQLDGRLIWSPAPAE